jgi:Tol biopolymer transport system component
MYSLAWGADGRDIVFSSDLGGVGGLWRILASPGAKPAAVSGFGEHAFDVAIAREGNRLAYVRAPYDLHISRLPRPKKPMERPDPTSFCRSTAFENGATYSPDGKRVAFTSNRLGNFDIWACDNDGLNPQQLTSRMYNCGTPHWSPNGRSVVFDSRASGDAAIWVVGADGGKAHQLTSGQNDYVPIWLGDWVYFSSTRKNSIEQIYKVRAEGGEEKDEKQLTTKQGGLARFGSADGRWVYYYARTHPPAIWKVAAEGGEESRVLEMPQGGDWRDWAVTDQGIYFLDANATPGPALKFFNFASGEISPIARIGKGPFEEVNELAVSPDGQSFLYGVRTYPREIWVVENFR